MFLDIGNWEFTRKTRSLGKCVNWKSCTLILLYINNLQEAFWILQPFLLNLSSVSAQKLPRLMNIEQYCTKCILYLRCMKNAWEYKKCRRQIVLRVFACNCRITAIFSLCKQIACNVHCTYIVQHSVNMCKIVMLFSSNFPKTFSFVSTFVL